MNIDKVRCKCFSMFDMSLSTLFGESPKIKYICGNCEGHNETRIPVESIEYGRPYTRCKFCGTTNVIPIHIEKD